ncbi:hypothetical protein DFO74_1575, partial [Chromohalobacter israelensis]
MDDEAAGSNADGFYIYQPDRFWEPFWEVFDKLGQLNNYCFNQLVASEAKLSELQAEYGRAVEEKNAGAEVLDYLSEEVPAWENNVAIFAKAAPIILLASFAEWGLKHICRVPDDRIAYRSYPLLAARELLQQFIREQIHG